MVANQYRLSVVPMFPEESLYVGVDVGKHKHVAEFLSKGLLQRHERFAACPALTFDNSRDGFRILVDRLRTYSPLEPECKYMRILCFLTYQSPMYGLQSKCRLVRHKLVTIERRRWQTGEANAGISIY